MHLCKKGLLTSFLLGILPTLIFSTVSFPTSKVSSQYETRDLSYFHGPKKTKVRQEGSNGDREMAASWRTKGFVFVPNLEGSWRIIPFSK